MNVENSVCIPVEMVLYLLLFAIIGFYNLLNFVLSYFLRR